MNAHAVNDTCAPALDLGQRWRQSVIWRWLVLPWRAHDQGGQWFMTIIALAAFGLAGLTVLWTRPVWQVPSAGMIGVAVGVAWLYFFPRCLRLMLAANALRLPRARREVHTSLLLYALLGCVVPACALGAAGGPGLAIGVWFFVGSAALFTFTLLPMWIAIGLMLLPAILANLSAWLGFSLPAPPQPGAPGFLAWLAIVGVALASVAVARWLIVTTRPQPTLRWRMCFALALSSGIQAWAVGQPRAGESERVRNRRAWLRPQPDLRGVGPARPVKSLRVAIGGAYAPVTWRSQALGMAWALASLGVAAAFMFVLTAGPHEGGAWLAHFMFVASGWFLLFIGLVSALSTLLLLHRRWSRPNASLALMALLPGLGRDRSIARHVIIAGVRTPLVIWLTLVVLAGVLIGWSGHGFPRAQAALFAGVALGGIIAIVTLALAILGRRRLTRAGIAVVSSYLCVLTVVSAAVAIAVFVPGGGGAAGFQPMDAAPIVLWIGLFVALVVVAWRGARVFVRQPHPFLARTS